MIEGECVEPRNDHGGDIWVVLIAAEDACPVVEDQRFWLVLGDCLFEAAKIVGEDDAAVAHVLAHQPADFARLVDKQQAAPVAYLWPHAS